MASDSDEVISLDEYIKDWAWNRYVKNRPRRFRRLKRENYDMNIIWDRCTFNHGEAKFNDEQTITVPHAQTLFRTTFNNNTGEDQDYSFQANRSSRSQATVSVSSGYTMGQEMGIKFSVPGNVVEANAGFKTEMSLTKESSQTFEEELSWGVDSQVRVKAHRSTLAEVEITEAKYSSNFVIETLVKGIVCVSLHKRKKGNAFVQMFEVDICRLLDSMMKGRIDNFHFENKGVVRIVTKGSCKFRYGCEQVVALKENPTK